MIKLDHRKFQSNWRKIMKCKESEHLYTTYLRLEIQVNQQYKL